MEKLKNFILDEDLIEAARKKLGQKTQAATIRAALVRVIE